MNVLPLLQNMPAGSNSRDMNQQTQAGQSGWQREMERAAAQSWLRHPAVGKQNSVISFGSHSYSTNRPLLRDSGEQPHFQKGLAAKDAGMPGQGEHSSASFKYSQAVDRYHASNNVMQGGAKQNVFLAEADADARIGNSDGMTDDLMQKISLSFSDAMDSSLVDAGVTIEIDNATDGCARSSTEFNLKLQASHEGSAAAAQQDLRLHAEWSGDGVRLWLGVDARNEAMIPQLSKHLLRQLSDRGIRVVSLVCNGKTLFEHSIQEYVG